MLGHAWLVCYVQTITRTINVVTHESNIGMPSSTVFNSSITLGIYIVKTTTGILCTEQHRGKNLVRLRQKSTTFHFYDTLNRTIKLIYVLGTSTKLYLIWKQTISTFTTLSSGSLKYECL